MTVLALLFNTQFDILGMLVNERVQHHVLDSIIQQLMSDDNDCTTQVSSLTVCPVRWVSE